jgi:sarcosine oxidase subunit beta
MTETAEAVVIGGGIIGTATAYHLAKTRMKVVLLERAFVGAGATGKSHSIVRMHYTNPHDAALAQLGLPYFQHWGDLVGCGECGFVQTGAFRFASAREEQKIRGNVEMLRGLGINTWVVDRQEIAELDRGLWVDDLTCAAWEPESGYADPLATANGFARATIAHGGEIRTGVTATAIAVERGRVAGIETTAGFIATDRVLVANGSWAAPLLAPHGFEVPLVPKRVQITVFRRPDTDRGPQTTLMDGSLGIVVRPECLGDCLVAIGFDPDEMNPDSFDEGIEPGFIAECRARLVKRRPAMTAAPSRGGWSGVAPETPDGHIVLDQLPGADGLFAAVGCSGTNFKTAPGIGRCLAEWMTGATPAVDLHAFRASRFAEGEPIRGQFEYGEGATDVWR